MEQVINLPFDDIRGFAAGLSALIQVAILPGWLVVLRFGIGTILADVLAAFVVSLVTTFNIALLLQLTGVYNRTALSVIVIGEIFLLTILNRRFTGVVTMSPLPLRPWPRNGFFAANVVALIIMVSFAMHMLMVLWSHVPGIFEEWDAVVSWNRWAVNWYEGRWPVETFGYPQLMPAMWSATYLWLGSDQIEIFARAFMGLFPIAILAIFFDFFLRWRRPAPLMAAVLLSVLLLGPYASVLDSGYVDIPLTFLIFLTGYLTYLSAQEGMPGERLLIFAGITAAAAVHCKQGGWLGAGILIAGIFSSLAGHLQIAPSRKRPVALLTIAIFAALVLPWFTLKWLNFIGHPEETNIRFVTSLIYGNETLLQRLFRAIKVTLPATLLPSGSLLGKSSEVLSVSFLLLLFASLWSKLGRMCLAVGIPYLFVWALFFSYDGRNLLPALPFLCLAIGFGLEQIMVWGIGSKHYEPVILDQNHPWNTKRIRYGLNLLIILVVLLALWPANPAGLKLWSDGLRLRSGDSMLNQQLLDFARQPGFHGQVLTTYPQMISIPALRPHVYTNEWRLPKNDETITAIKAGRSFCEILSTMPRSQTITYALIHNDSIPSLIDAALADGSLQPVITAPTIRLMRVRCTH